MSLKRYDCVHCGTEIPFKRAFTAVARGAEPKFCSLRCMYRFHNRKAYRKRKANR